MTSQIVGTAEPIQPLNPATFKDSGWAQTLFFVLVAPVVLTGVQKLWALAEKRVAQKYKKEDSDQQIKEKREEAERSSVEKIVEKSLANKDLFISEFQKQYNVLLQEIISANDEKLKSIQASLSTTVGVLATVAENQKAYAEIAMKRSDDTRLILEEIRKASTHTVIESMNSHVKINYLSVQNQQKILAEVTDLKRAVVKLHERLDKHYGSDRVD